MSSFQVCVILTLSYNSMSIFLNGEFKIQNSWNQRASSKQSGRSGKRPPSANRPISRQNKSLVNVGQKIIGPPIPDSLDSYVADKIYKDFQAQIPPPPTSSRSDRKSRSKEPVPTPKFPPRQRTNADDDLISSMANRLKQVEVTCNSLRNQLKEKNAQLQRIKGENTFLKGMRENSDQKYQQFKQLKQKNAQLEKKNQEMEDYLKKYGMKWVGNNPEGKLDKEKMKKDIANAKNNYRLPSQIDIGTIQRRVQQLNGGLHSEGHGTQIYSENGVHKFRKAQPLPIAFFADGIGIKGMNFYPYKSKESLRILSDLVDGYFPYVLKQKYPNGVFLKVVDMIAIKYQDYEKQGSQSIASIEGINKNDFKPMSKDQFLNKLPKQIIKNGKVISVRDQIGKMFDPDTKTSEKQDISSQFAQQIDGNLVFKTDPHNQIKNNEKQYSDFCTLKIRTESGKVCILELQKTDKIKQVYSWMKKIVKQKFHLMGNFPRRSYEQTEKQNMQELGLYPNAILHIQLIK